MTDIWNQQYLDGQARYFPHEELVRFLGRTYGSCKTKPCAVFSAAEIGCGAGGNLTALMDWGFDTYGYDCSPKAVQLAEEHCHAAIDLYTAPQRLPHADASLDLVIDIQCIQHLTDAQHAIMYSEIARVLKPNGFFFSVHWKMGDQKKIFPAHPELTPTGMTFLGQAMRDHGLTVTSHEEIERSYHSLTSYAKWHVIEAMKR